MIKKMVCSDGITRWYFSGGEEEKKDRTLKISDATNLLQETERELLFNSSLLKIKISLGESTREIQFLGDRSITSFRKTVDFGSYLKPTQQKPVDYEVEFKNFLIEIGGRKFLISQETEKIEKRLNISLPRISGTVKHLISPLERFGIVLHFAEEWKKGSLLIHGYERPIFGKEIYGKTRITKILRAAKSCFDFKIPIDLFVGFHFWETNFLHSKPSLFTISKISYIKKYQTWFKKFSSVEEARRSLYPPSSSETFDKIIEKDHKRFLFYKESTGLPSRHIFRMHAMEFNAFYLLSCPEFQEAYRQDPNILLGSSKRNYERAKSEVSGPRNVNTFWRMMRDLKCSQKNTRI